MDAQTGRRLLKVCNKIRSFNDNKLSADMNYHAFCPCLIIDIQKLFTAVIMIGMFNNKFFVCWVIFMIFLSSAYFFKINFKKNLSGTLSEC